MKSFKKFMKTVARRAAWFTWIYARRAAFFVYLKVLHLWRAAPVVFIRRRVSAADQVVYDAFRLWIHLWIEQSKMWPPPHPRWFVRLYRKRREIRNRLRAIAVKLSVPVRVVGAAEMRKNALGCYRRNGGLPQIEMLDVRQDDPWVLAHELGHHLAIQFRDDTREAAADEEGRKLVEQAAGADASWVAHVARARLPANGCLRPKLLIGPVTFLSLLVIGFVLLAMKVDFGANLVQFVVVGGFFSSMFGFAQMDKRVDPYPRATPRYKVTSSKQDLRIEKLRRLRDDPNATFGERRNAANAIKHMQTKETR